MLTSHSILQEKYLRKAQALDILILILSSLLVATVFIDSKIIALISNNENFARIIIGIFSVLVFCLTIVQFKVDWKQVADQHCKAFEVLVQFKHIFRNLKDADDLNKDCFDKTMEDYKLATSFICKIPEKYFHRLKSKHLKKVILSKLIRINPSSSIFVIKLYIFFKGNSKKVKNI